MTGRQPWVRFPSACALAAVSNDTTATANTVFFMASAPLLGQRVASLAGRRNGTKDQWTPAGALPNVPRLEEAAWTGS